VDEEPIAGLTAGVLRRYDAFHRGDDFNPDLLTITENRILGIGVVQDIHFTTSCNTDGVLLHQTTVSGKPSFLSVGAGIDTEGIISGKASWRSSRLGSLASWSDLTFLASAQDQRLSFSLNGYFLSPSSRFNLRPLFELRHQNEISFEAGTVRGLFAANTTWDSANWGATFMMGPNLDLLRTYRGKGPSDSHFLSLETRIEAKSHDFEYYRTNPQSGFSASLLNDISERAIYSQVSVQRYRIQAQGLWNFDDFDPPLLIFGIRMGAATLFTPERAGDSSLLPPTYLEYLGGSNDLRGFSRKELPTNGLGALTSLYVDFEVRLGTELPYGIGPVAFIDFGVLGSNPISYAKPLYWSPGVGIRWASPLGVFRTTFAHGFTDRTPGHFQIFLSYGEEF
jgi:translocation and assembly module TamA